MPQIHSSSLTHLFFAGYTLAQRVFQSNKARLGFALAIIAATIYWWRSRETDASPLTGRVTPTLEQQVAQVEAAVKTFWDETASRITHPSRAVTSNVLEQKIKLDLEQLQNQVRALPILGAPDAIEKRIHALYESTMLSKKSDDASAKTTPKSDLANALLKKRWSEQLDEYEQCVNSCLQDSSLLSELDQYNDLYLDQVRELYKFENKDEFLSCIIRIHAVRRRLLTPGTVIAPVVVQPTRNAFGGLERAGNNSCYLATALHLLRVVGSLRDRFDPSMNPLQDAQKTEIQKVIHSMLTRMDRGETIPAQVGRDLQALLKRINILNRDVYGFYDAGEIAAQLLLLVESELPSGLQSVKRVDTADSGELSEVFEDYRLAVVVPPGELVDVAAAVKRLTTKREETVVEHVGHINHIYEVTSLPEFMVVEFLGPRPQLYNATKFEDPLDSRYEYELVFGMENTGGHWIAHVLCMGNQWMTANDATIHPMRQDALTKINRGYYVRKAKS